MAGLMDYFSGLSKEFQNPDRKWETPDTLGAIGTIGSSVAGIVSGYKADLGQYKTRKAFQNYHNSMVNLSNAVSQNAITINQIATENELIEESVNIQMDAMSAKASAEVMAAAAGVKGGSVEGSLFDINRNAARAEFKRSETFKLSQLNFDYQRTVTALGAEMQQDRSYIAKPSLATSILGAF